MFAGGSPEGDTEGNKGADDARSTSLAQHRLDPPAPVAEAAAREETARGAVRGRASRQSVLDVKEAPATEASRKARPRVHAVQGRAHVDGVGAPAARAPDASRDVVRAELNDNPRLPVCVPIDTRVVR